MKPDLILLLALWLIDRTSPQPAAESFAGDLLELHAQGRSRWWCLAQALFRSLSALERRLRTLQTPLLYSVVFVALYPLWQCLYAPSVADLLTHYRGTTPWPGSALLEMTAGILPALVFLGIGILIYLLLRPQTLRALTPVSLLLTLNAAAASLSALIILRLGSFQHDLRFLSHADFYYPFVHAHFSLLLFVSLWMSLATLPPPSHHLRPRRFLATLTPELPGISQ